MSEDQVRLLDEELVFHPWPHVVNDRRDLRPEGLYSRLAWLPTVGPTSWLLWGTIAAELHDKPELRVSRRELSRSLGLGPSNRRGPTIRAPLRRLCCFGLFGEPAGVYRVRLTAPPVSPNALERMSPAGRQLHADLFGDRLR
jgi:hypothetical protein